MYIACAYLETNSYHEEFFDISKDFLLYHNSGPSEPGEGGMGLWQGEYKNVREVRRQEPLLARTTFRVEGQRGLANPIPNESL